MSRQSCLVCNGSIIFLKKSFKLTSWTHIYPAKWSTEARDYQKIKKAHFLYETEMKQNSARQSLINMQRCFWQTVYFYLDYFSFNKFKQYGVPTLFASSVSDNTAQATVFCSIACHSHGSHQKTWQMNSFFSEALSELSILNKNRGQKQDSYAAYDKPENHRIRFKFF